MHLRAFVFDIGGVLIDFDFDKIVAKIAGGDPAVMRRANLLRTDPSLIEAESGRMRGVDYFLDKIRPLAPHWTYDDFVHAWADVLTPNQKGQMLLRAVQEAGYRVFFLSNAAEYNVDAMNFKFPGFLSQPVGCFVSWRMGMVKPDVAIYEAVAHQINVEASNCLFLDDVQDNVDAARKAGMTPLLFSTREIAEVRRKISRLTDKRVPPT
jgi:putative hydrolase of the HAD superfamily